MTIRKWITSIILILGICVTLTTEAGQFSDAVSKAYAVLQNNRDEGLAQLNKLVESGDTTAALLLYTLYYQGEYGLPKNEETANKYLLMAADAGNVDAQLKYGSIFLPKKETQEACRWWFIARLHADKGVLSAEGATFSPGGVGNFLSAMCEKMQPPPKGFEFDVAKAKSDAASWTPKPMVQKSRPAQVCTVDRILALKTAGLANDEIKKLCP